MNIFNKKNEERPPSYWREKLLDLASLTPFAFSFLHLNKEIFVKAYNSVAIKKFNSFDENQFYFIFNEKKIYGIFQGFLISQEEIVFRNLPHYFQPIAIPQKTNVLTVLEKLTEANSSKTNTLLSFEIKKKRLHLTIANEEMPGFISNFFQNKIKDINNIEQLSEKLKKLLAHNSSSNQKSVFTEISLLGAKLGKAIPLDKILKSALAKINNFYVQNNSPVPLQTINYSSSQHGTKKKFPFLEALTIFTPNHNSISYRNEHTLMHSISVLNLLNDEENAKLESRAIANCLNESKSKTAISVVFQNITLNLESLFANSDCLHLIAHGKTNGIKKSNTNNSSEDEYVFAGNKNSISCAELLNFKKMPILLFLSACDSDQEKIIIHFFKNGGKALITADGLLFNEKLDIYIKKFYQTLFSGGSLKFAFNNMQKKMLEDQNPNCFRIKFYGQSEDIAFKTELS